MLSAEWTSGPSNEPLVRLVWGQLRATWATGSQPTRTRKGGEYWPSWSVCGFANLSKWTVNAESPLARLHWRLLQETLKHSIVGRPCDVGADRGESDSADGRTCARLARAGLWPRSQWLLLWWWCSSRSTTTDAEQAVESPTRCGLSSMETQSCRAHGYVNGAERRCRDPRLGLTQTVHRQGKGAIGCDRSALMDDCEGRELPADESRETCAPWPMTQVEH